MKDSRLILSVLAAGTVLTGSINAEEKKRLEDVVVTATREAKPKSEVAESVTVTDSEEIDFVAPAHPSEVLNRSAGVHINNLGGEGHMTAIRQPISTGGVYLFLEDGVPTRPTGLFNHNALYETNVPQADRIEVIKGPGSALYGSDSIGGIINSITKPSPDKKEMKVNPEFGSFGWKRLLATGGAPGFRLDLNLTDNDGFREEAKYSRYASTARLDGFLGDNTAYKSILTYSQVAQSGISSLKEDDYKNNTTKNTYHNDVGRRDVNALRWSTEFAYEPNDNSLYTLTPFFRDNQMKLMPSWMLGYDPNDRDYKFQSYGLLAKHRYKLPNSKTEFISGVDVDYTQSTYEEVQITPTKDDENNFIDTVETGTTNYDFDADQLSVSPYLHGEFQASESLRVSTGVRYDYFSVDYENNLDTVTENAKHLRPESEKVSYDHLSPKFGLTYALSKVNNLYLNYRNSFRVPSIGQLFRSGSTKATNELKPVKTDSYEVGARGKWFGWLKYDAAAYHMSVKDDIVNYIDGNDRKLANAGETEHQGVELGFNGDISKQFSFRTALSYTNQKYKDFSATQGFPAKEINFADNDVSKAPKTLGNLAIQFKPSFLPGSMFEVEGEHVGKYYTGEDNTGEYAGHNLVNVRANYKLSDSYEFYGRMLNATDELYSTYTRNSVGSDDIEYRPGSPRSFFLGVKARF